MKPVTVSIVSHGQAALVRPLLCLLDQFCHDQVDKVVVTLNLPEDLAVQTLALRFPLQILVNPQAKGFGSNHNQAFAECRTPWFLVLNPDIAFDRDVISPLLAEALPGTGLLAPQVFEPLARQPTPERGVITPWEIIAGRLKQRRPPPRPVWFPGMFMLFRSEAFAQLQGFDERFFMYCEDFDVCARLGLRGWALARSHQTQVLHQAQRHSHVRPRYLYWHVRSLLRLWASTVLWRYRRRVQQTV